MPKMYVLGKPDPREKEFTTTDAQVKYTQNM